MSDECLELKNIKYQTMLLSNNYNKKEELTVYYKIKEYIN